MNETGTIIACLSIMFMLGGFIGYCVGRAYSAYQWETWAHAVKDAVSDFEKKYPAGTAEERDLQSMCPRFPGAEQEK